MSILNRFQQIIVNRSCSKINLKSLKYYSTEEATSEVEQQEGFI
jgi:type IV secretory pathway TraG/TraD family ATPase VirD4